MKDKAFREKVEKSIQTCKEKARTSQNNQGQMNQDQKGQKNNTIPEGRNATFAAFCSTSFSAANSLVIKWSWILDNGSNRQISNETMKSRKVKTRDASKDDYLAAGANYLKVEFYGTIRINIPALSGPWIITLVDVAYVPRFMTNVVAQHLFNIKSGTL